MWWWSPASADPVRPVQPALAGQEQPGAAWMWVCGGRGARPGESAPGQAQAGGCSDFQADDYFMESSEVQSYVCLLSAVTLSLFNVVLTAARFYKSK